MDLILNGWFLGFGSGGFQVFEDSMIIYEMTPTVQSMLGWYWVSLAAS